MYVLQVKPKHTDQRFGIVWDGSVKPVTDDDRTVTEFMEIEARYRTIGPPGGPSVTGIEILRDPVATYLLAKELFELVELVSGELPTPDDVPEGAVP